MWRQRWAHTLCANGQFSFSYRPSYNVSPAAYMPVVRREDGSGGEGFVLHCMKWGLIPSFTKQTEKPDHFRMFNARSESIGEKASFRRLVPNNRCLVAVEGFYEWKKDGTKKQPYYIHFKDERPLVFAALYDSWKNSEGEVLYTFTIVTTCSSSSLQWLHDRMPVILGNEGSTDAWLNGSLSKLDSVLKPYGDPDLVWNPVTLAMGKTSFNGPECIKEIQLKSEEKNSISKFFTKKRTENQQETARTNLLENVKDEPGNQEDTEDPTDSKGNNGSKPDVSSLLNKEAEKCGIKREYEESAADLKSMIDSTDKSEASHAKKKANLKSAGDNQPTLLSYFGKS
ncbi:abasic site processing protein YoqW isoform X2 [Macadamia integrifolia]|uniref:abasic site processing protein YoqW isoform X2 n=1 Tax=Macadamia integrifolia TaxID=60698 RepID=UPI001C4E64B2|nr:abasic site processing protein YoqW isoform X2 [Macadamia integrifolia]